MTYFLSKGSVLNYHTIWKGTKYPTPQLLGHGNTTWEANDNCKKLFDIYDFEKLFPKLALEQPGCIVVEVEEAFEGYLIKKH